MDRKKIVEIARQWVGTPFVHRGRSPGGVDCVGLLRCVADELGYPPYDCAAYSRQPNPREFLRWMTECPFLYKKLISNRKAGDILLFANPMETVHCGIMTETNSVIHALNSRGWVCEHGIRNGWEKKIRTCYEFREIKND